MSNLVQPSDVTALVPTGLSTNDLAAVISRVEDYITDKIGAPYATGLELTETVKGGYGDVFTKRRISAVVSVTEYQQLSSSTGTALADGTTMFVWQRQGRITRLGVNAFGERVDIVYTPIDEREKRKQAIIDLVRLELSRSALKSERVAGEYDYTALDNYEAERRRIMRRLTLSRV